MEVKIYYSKDVNLKETKQILKELEIENYSFEENELNEKVDKNKKNILITNRVKDEHIKKFGKKNVIGLDGIAEKRLIVKIEELLGKEAEVKLNIQTFGFKYDEIPNVNFLFDVRFLKNPYYIEELREKTGLEEEVSKYVFKDGRAEECVIKIMEFLEYQIPLHKESGRRKINIGIACTGGKHRSVAISEELKKRLEKKYKTNVFHRDVKKG